MVPSLNAGLFDSSNYFVHTYVMTNVPLLKLCSFEYNHNLLQFVMALFQASSFLMANGDGLRLLSLTCNEMVSAVSCSNE